MHEVMLGDRRARELLRAVPQSDDDLDEPGEAPRLRERHPQAVAQTVLFGHAAALFNAYGHFASVPPTSLGGYRFSVSGIEQVLVLEPGSNSTVRGTLVRSPRAGGAVSSVEITLCHLTWDAALRVWAAADPARGSALDVLVEGLLAELGALRPDPTTERIAR